MNKKKIMKLRCKLACAMCKGKYRSFARKLFNYVKKNYELEEGICSDLGDIWDMLIDNSSRNIDFNHVIKDEVSFIKDAFSDFPQVKESNLKFFLYLILFVVIIPALIGFIIFIQITKY